MRITELKRHLDGRVERFECDLVLRDAHVVVVRFDHTTTRMAGGLVFPKGSRSFGFFWPRRPYLLYRMIDPKGGLIAHRFDVVEDVRLASKEVSYTDLLLDIWVDPQGRMRVEDEADVIMHADRGLLSPAQRARIDRARGVLGRRHTMIEREAARLLVANTVIV